MLKIPGRYIGDAWYYVDDGKAHCYFLTQPDSTSLNERGLHWDTGHAISTNLVDWEFVGLAMSRGMPGEWDGHKLSTGSVIKRDGRKESVKFDKITARIEKLSYGLNTKYENQRY